MRAANLVLWASGLLHKAGFEDGDVVDLWLLDAHNVALEDHMADGEGDWEPSASHKVLIALVRRYVLPLLDAAGHTYEVVEYGTIHNPIRLRKLNGREVDWFEDNSTLDGLRVELTKDQVVEIVAELAAKEKP